jgi:hypothetical protein
VSGLEPRLHEGAYAFVSLAPGASQDGLEPVASVREPEGWTLVLPLEQARARGLEPVWVGAWITLTAQTSLTQVGLTARFAAALAAEQICCNVVAGAWHDHLFVPLDRQQDALRLLQQMAP